MKETQTRDEMTFLKVTAQLYMCYGPYYSGETDVNSIEAETAAQARHVFETFYPTDAARGKVRGGKTTEDFVQTLTIAVDLEGEDYDCKAYECAEWIPAAWFDEVFGFEVNDESMTFRYMEGVPEGVPVFYLDEDRPGAVVINPGYDRDGYDEEGYDEEGYDRDGYDEEGYDGGGYDRDGKDESGGLRGAYTWN